MNIFKDIDIVAFDILGVILTKPSLVRKGLGVDDPDIARKEFLDAYEINDGFEEFRNG
jgi:hypothetical protein